MLFLIRALPNSHFATKWIGVAEASAKRGKSKCRSLDNDESTQHQKQLLGQPWNRSQWHFWSAVRTQQAKLWSWRKLTRFLSMPQLSRCTCCNQLVRHSRTSCRELLSDIRTVHTWPSGKTHIYLNWMYGWMSVQSLKRIGWIFMHVTSLLYQIPKQKFPCT